RAIAPAGGCADGGAGGAADGAGAAGGLCEPSQGFFARAGDADSSGGAGPFHLLLERAVAAARRLARRRHVYAAAERADGARAAGGRELPNRRVAGRRVGARRVRSAGGWAGAQTYPGGW